MILNESNKLLIKPIPFFLTLTKRYIHISNYKLLINVYIYILIN